VFAYLSEDVDNFVHGGLEKRAGDLDAGVVVSIDLRGADDGAGRAVVQRDDVGIAEVRTHLAEVVLSSKFSVNAGLLLALE